MKAPQLGIPQPTSNWFDTGAVACLYERFCALDSDNSGTLSPQEFAGYASYQTSEQKKLPSLYSVIGDECDQQ